MRLKVPRSKNVASFYVTKAVYEGKKERVKAHFMTCFLALVLFRYLEKKLENRFTCEEILGTLCSMNFLETSAGDYIPTYTRTDLTDALHEAFGFRTDYQIIERKNMKGIFKITKNRKLLLNKSRGNFKLHSLKNHWFERIFKVNIFCKCQRWDYNIIVEKNILLKKYKNYVRPGAAFIPQKDFYAFVKYIL